MICPKCGSSNVYIRGSYTGGTVKLMCLDCGHEWVGKKEK